MWSKYMIFLGKFFLTIMRRSQGKTISHYFLFLLHKTVEDVSAFEISSMKAK